MKKGRRLPLVAAFLTALVTAGVVLAASVTPTLIPGPNNEGKTCDEIYGEGTTTQIQGLDVSVGSHTVSSGALSVTYQVPSAVSGAPAASLDFQAGSDTTVIGVVVKDGVDGANWYDYSPDGVKSDTLLTTPGPPDGTYKGISHINFCVIETPKAEPDISTVAATDGEGQAGDTLTDTAYLTGGSTDPVMGGTVDFSLYNLDDDPNCEGTPIFTDTQNVVGDASGEADVTSAGYLVLEAGTYGWIAEYSGDDNNEGAGPTDCGEESETLTFAAAATTVVTELHYDDENHTVFAVGSEIALGSKVHDSATVTGPATLDTPEGDVDFTFFTGGEGDCESGTSESAGNVDLVDGVADPSTAFGPLAAGQYAFIAHYNSSNTDVWTDGDSTCEPFTVGKAQLTADTILHNADHDEIADGSNVPLGTVMHDTAQITGAVDGFDPTGAVTFAFYSEADCGGEPVAFDNTGPDEDSSDPRSEDSDPLAAGSYGFKASVAGDDNYEGDTSDCEPFTVDKADLGFRTDIHDSAHNVVTSVPNNSVVHDTATLSNVVTGFDPDLADITFEFFTNGTCEGEGSSVLQDTPESALVARTVDSAPLTSGAYSYKAEYAGDENYNPAEFPCEPLSVRTFGKTMGFWGNRNGQALLPTNPGVTLGINSATTCYIVVNTKAISKTILPTTLNGVSILTNCSSSGQRDPDINANSINTLLAQTLALSFNILYINGYAGQTIGGMGCTPVGTLTNTSTVQDVRDYANTLIGNIKLGAPTVTQAQIGELNTLLGCLNAEA